jgi:uncharacterized protein YeaO (DUF488 family)
MSDVRIKRAYEPASDEDGQRVLIDRLWPRGISKDKAKLDDWLKDVAPSADLRKWFDHEPERWPDFKQRYLAELAANPALAELRALAEKGRLTLVYGARDEAHNDAVVLAKLLTQG